MAQKPNKKANPGKPIYKARQPATAPAASASAATSEGPTKSEPVNWASVMNNASK